MKVISLGMGLQSVGLYLMSSLGILPRADYAIFADPGREKRKTSEYLLWLLDWQKQNDGIPIIVNGSKNLYTDLLNKNAIGGKRFSSIPAFTQGIKGKVGMLRRQCTGEYKIEVVYKTIRQLYGLAPKKRFPKTEIWIGVSLDEMQRMQIPQNKWATNYYPYCGYQVTHNDYKKISDHRMTRQDIINWFERNHFPVPTKSACVFCPYHADADWQRMKEEEPEDFADAVLVDRAIRDSVIQGVKKPVYLHESLIPLEQVKFTQSTLFKGDCAVCHI